MGMFFFVPFPFPNCGNGFFSFPSRSRILGIDYSFPSHSRIEGMVFLNSLPIPELREQNHPFPFPDSQMSFPLTPGQRFMSAERKEPELRINNYYEGIFLIA